MPEILKTKRNKTTKNKKNFSTPVNYMLSALKGFIVASVLLSVLSFLLMNNGSFSAFYKAFAYISLGLGAFMCGFSSYRHIKGRGITNGALGGGVFCILIMVALLCFMRFNISSSILYVVPLSIACGIAGGIAGANL